MHYRIILCFAATVASVFSADWNPRAAADYLDGRQKEWLAWPAAKNSGGSCVSCHTGAPYLLARPMLGKVLGESAPTEYENALLASLKTRLPETDPKKLNPKQTGLKIDQAAGVESVFAALFVAIDSPTSQETSKAFDRLWSMQLPNGAIPWFSLGLDPWEETDSQFYGATLAAAAVGYRGLPQTQPNTAALKTYIRTNLATQPLHNQLSALWAATKWKGLITAAERKKIIATTIDRQQPDGGWTIGSLGTFKPHPDALIEAGSNSYATALTSFILLASGEKPTKNSLAQALEWLRTHQDKAKGSWAAASMNKSYKPESMMVHFMEDAATSYAAMALSLGQR